MAASVPSSQNETLEGVAIVGMSGRFPGARSLEDFWRNLRDGVEAVSTFTEDDLASEGLDPAMLNYPGFINRAGILEDIDLFDAPFFGYTPREAEIADPQQRLFLECAWEALESAGYVPETYPGLIGVYAGVAMSKYLYNLFANQEIMAMMGPFQVMLGNDKDHLTTRVAYKLNLRGPAVTVQTTCSTSLVSVVVATQSLLNYQCDMALAGGASISVPQRTGGFFQEGGISAPDGRCRAFDARAQGTVGGNGVGVVLLKRLADAVADGDTIHAVIRGVAINNDGGLKVGYTAPSVAGQAEVIAMAHAMAGVDVETITYVEAHGTGTPLGDPIEVAALTQAFRAHTTKQHYCAIGSVKTNIGHLDPAAGVAGLIKTVLSLEHGMVPPSLHFEQPNPRIDFENSPFYVADKLIPWPANGVPRRAGVSSFGIGGTNAHVVLEEAPASRNTRPARRWSLIPLAAKTNAALEQVVANLAGHLHARPELGIADVAYTQAIGRREFSQRRAVVCEDSVDAITALRKNTAGKASESAAQPSGPVQIAFMFSGQGTQHAGMASELYEVEPDFRQIVDECAQILEPHLAIDLRQLLYPRPKHVEAANVQLRNTAMAQPALFVTEYALARLLMQWGLQPAALIGHSIGEYVAACLAGVFALEDALMMVAERGRLMQSMPEGAMLAVTLSEAEANGLLGENLSLASVNTPLQSVISGLEAAVAQVEADLTARGVFCRRLHTSHAFHSAMMEPIIEPFIEIAQRVAFHPPLIPFVSNVSGTWITSGDATDPRYWGAQIRQTVRFADGVQRLMQQPDVALVEVGPGNVLASLAAQVTPEAAEHLVLPTLPRPVDRQSDYLPLLGAVGRLWAAGAHVDWPAFYRHEQRRRVPLPTYPFERQRYWIGPAKPVNGDARPQRAHEPAADISRWFYVPAWKRSNQPIATPAAPEVGSRWLVFMDDAGVGESLVRQLRHDGHDVTTVFKSDHYEESDEAIYALRPDSRDDYERLLQSLATSAGPPQTIVHLWSVSSAEMTGSGEDVFDACQEVGYFSVLSLTQALARQVLTHPIQVAVVATDVLGHPGSAPTPEKATVLGLCKVIPQEYPNLTCRVIDITLDTSGGRQQERLAGQLAAELAQGGNDLTVALRGADRWVQVYEPLELGEAVEATPLLRKQGVYLITGGLGGIGLLIAEHLARTEQARLVLVQRAPFPAQNLWEQWLETRGPADATSRKIRTLQAIRQAGGDMMIASADVSDPQQMQEVVRRARERFGRIDGVIHAAGITSASAVRSVRDIDPAISRRQFRAKVQGLYVLRQALQDAEPEFYALFSSLSTVLGGLGFGAYASANAFMDAFALAQHERGTARWISIDWDGWQLTEAPAPPAAERSIRPSEGIQAFRRSLSVAPRVVVATGDLQARIDKWVNLKSVRETNGASGDAAGHARPNLATPYAAPTNDIENTVCRVWAELLGIDRVGLHDNFFELGGHSLLAIQAISRLRDALNMELSVQTLFDQPTPGAFVQTLGDAETLAGDADARLAELLELVEHLPEDEVRRLLGDSSFGSEEG